MTSQDTAIAIRVWITVELIMGLANTDPYFIPQAQTALDEWFDRIEESRMRQFPGMEGK